MGLLQVFGPVNKPTWAAWRSGSTTAQQKRCSIKFHLCVSTDRVQCSLAIKESLHGQYTQMSNDYGLFVTYIWVYI